MDKVVLCAELDSLVHPDLIGLDGATLDGLDWLEPVCEAAMARERVSLGGVAETWVVASDDMTGVNLAAALRRDAPSLPVYLVAFEPNGSEVSRAQQAGVTGILDGRRFRERFDSWARRTSMIDDVSVPDIDEPPMHAGPAAADAPAETAQKPGRPNADPSSASGRKTQGAHVRKDASQAFVLSVMSGSGGVGKSTVAALSGCLAAQRGFRVAVVDLDLQFGDMAQVMGKAPSVSADDALAEDDGVRALASKLPAGEPAVISAPSRLERSEELISHLGGLLDACCAEFDVVVVNTGSNWTESHAQLLERSSCAVFLMDQRASSVRACQHALDLCMRLGIATGSFVYALNRCERGALFSAVDIANVMQGAHVFELKDGGSEVEELLGAGLAFELASGKNELCSSVDAMLDEILPAGGAFFTKRPARGKSGGITFGGEHSVQFVMPEARPRRRGRQRRSDKKGASPAVGSVENLQVV